jgi:small subunit ribosomal protein S6
MNRIYEELFIVRPELTEEEITPIVEQFRGIITQAGGTIDKEERWGVRKLAYRIAKKSEGFYILLQFTAPASTVRELERRLRVHDAVMKYITVRIDEKMKWLEKRRKQREKRAARRPAITAPAPVASTEEGRPAMPALPGAPMPGAPVSAAPAEGGEAEPAAAPVTAPETAAETNEPPAQEKE